MTPPATVLSVSEWITLPMRCGVIDCNWSKRLPSFSARFLSPITPSISPCTRYRSRIPLPVILCACVYLFMLHALLLDDQDPWVGIRFYTFITLYLPSQSFTGRKEKWNQFFIKMHKGMIQWLWMCSLGRWFVLTLHSSWNAQISFLKSHSTVLTTSNRGACNQP